MTIRPSRQFRLRLASAAFTIASSISGLAVAQEVPEGQSCGGLVCDLGLFGHKAAPKLAAEPIRAPSAIAPPPAEVASQRRPKGSDAPAADAKPSRRRAHVVKIAPQPFKEARPTTVPAPTRDMPTISLASPPFSAIPMPDDPVVPAAAPPPRPVPVVAPPTPDVPVVMANPYVYTRPLPFMFQSVDPTQGVQ